MPKLIAAARCALADLIYCVCIYDDDLEDDTMLTVVELYDSLKELGEDVSDYEGEVEEFRKHLLVPPK
jgi:Ca2+-binding EF-hand superfamily protein